VGDFIEFVTGEAKQLDMADTLSRLPGRISAQSADFIVNDPVFTGAAEAVKYGTPMPSVLEMRANWDAMKPEMSLVLSGSKSPEDAAEAMQAAAEAGIRALE
jgi:arabinogalactan oligomer/maltooligosaccharide transport system substrate-binding protein